LITSAKTDFISIRAFRSCSSSPVVNSYVVMYMNFWLFFVM